MENNLLTAYPGFCSLYIKSFRNMCMGGGEWMVGDGLQLLKLTEINPFYLPSLVLEAARLNRLQSSKIIASVLARAVVWVGRQIPSAFYSTIFRESCSPPLFFLPCKWFWISLNVSKKAEILPHYIILLMNYSNLFKFLCFCKYFYSDHLRINMVFTL